MDPIERDLVPGQLVSDSVLPPELILMGLNEGEGGILLGRAGVPNAAVGGSRGYSVGQLFAATN
ncbi:hypothetical protein [Levilactobacillus senmaizukei]|uniref:hypothetical protein n=1 Tax=Levilactobacillus senmaizukei TaxID=431273 RepID=UPI001F1BE521|nr:hypothetical protein [Levilactobacillus senmaizukei]